MLKKLFGPQIEEATEELERLHFVGLRGSPAPNNSKSHERNEVQFSGICAPTGGLALSISVIHRRGANPKSGVAVLQSKLF